MTKSQVEEAKQQLDDALRALGELNGRAAVPKPAPVVQAAAGAPAVSTNVQAPRAVTAALPQATASTAPPDPVHTLTRFIVGAALLGMDELARRAPEWERQAAQGAAPEEDEALARVAAQIRASAPPGAEDEMRLALIGWIFETQARLRSAPDAGHWIQSAASTAFDTATALAGQTLGAMFRGRRSAAARPADADVARWISLGRAEERRSRALAQIALSEIVHEAIGFLAREPALQELVQTQSTTLATEALEEVRERTVSADLLVDRLVGRLFRRAPTPILEEAAILAADAKRRGTGVRR